MYMINCKDCGRLHLKGSWSSAYCLDCLQQRAQLSRTIRGYLEAHPGATVMEVHLDTGIPLGMLLEYRKEQKLS